jgi:two-component system LytT family response regulator
MKIRSLIVDDEALARKVLSNLLQSEPDIEVLGECADASEALAAIRKQAPDLVFMDVEMPGLNGFATIKEVGDELKPVFVFVTAHEKFAAQAFDAQAADYLVKPFDKERFHTAVERAKGLIEEGKAQRLGKQISSLLSFLKPESKRADRLVVKSNGRILFIRTTDVDWVEAADNYVSLHVGKESYLLRETMNSLEGRLPAEQFVRISRSAIVNIEQIRELKPLFHGDYAVILRNDTQLTLSRSYRSKLQQLGLE